MKYALFDFVNENVYVVGETRWITREDHKSFVLIQAAGWMAAWPIDFIKNNLSMKIVKD